MARLAPSSRRARLHAGRGEVTVAGVPCRVARSGYTGEDGFEISVAADRAEDLARRLLEAPEVAPAGLGARDSLRLEAGLCLYGHELTTATTPVEAQLGWTIARRRRAEGGFPGAATILEQLERGPGRKLVGLRPQGRAPAREGTEVQDQRGQRVGVVTSGGFGPTVDGPIALGYVESAHATPGTAVQLAIRGRRMPPMSLSCRSLPTATSADGDQPDVRRSVTPKSTNGFASTARSPRSGSAITRRSSSATWCSSSCPTSADGSAAARPWPWSRASRRRATSTRRSGARSSRSTQALNDDPALVNSGAESKGWFCRLRGHRPARTRPADGCRRLQGVRREPGLRRSRAAERSGETDVRKQAFIGQASPGRSGDGR